jgi:TDG/mug DNA glycosylase family protein
MTLDSPRLLPDEPMPPYAFVPGQSPHPLSDPLGHSFGQLRYTPLPLDPDDWQGSRDYLRGIDLFNYGYYWEAHEAWEGLWHAAGRGGMAADFLKGLIKLAAAGVKHLEGKAAGVASHARRAAELWQDVERTLGAGSGMLFGMRIVSLIDLVESIGQVGWPGSPPRLWPSREIAGLVAHQFKPTREQLSAAHDRIVPDIIALNLHVLFVGINPGLYSAAIGHHFGRPGNRFWPALFGSGFTPRLFSPFDERELLPLRLGITNIAERASARADELTGDELRAGAVVLEKKVRQYRPRIVAFLGVTAYREALSRPKAATGRQSEPFGEAIAWVLPNPSGLNAHYQAEDLARLFAELREAAADTNDL